MIQRIYYLDGLRGILAYSVALSHMIGGMTVWAPDRLFAGAFLAVDLFFVLSGFVLAKLLYAQKYSALAFFQMRFWRLWPLHFATILICIAVFEFNRQVGHYAPPFGNINDHWLILKNAAFLMTLGIVEFPVINPPSWSIGIEFWASAILLPVFVRMRWDVLLSLCVAGYCYIAFKNSGLSTYATVYPFVSLGLLKGVSGMALGVVAFKVEKNVENVLSKIDDQWHTALITILLLFIMSGIIWQNNSIINFTIVAAIFPLLSVKSFERCNYINHFLSSKPLVWLGTISFSLYLIHTPILVLLSPPTLASRFGAVNATIILTFVCIACAAALHYWLEVPISKIIKKSRIKKPAFANRIAAE